MEHFISHKLKVIELYKAFYNTTHTLMIMHTYTIHTHTHTQTHHNKHTHTHTHTHTPTNTHTHTHTHNTSNYLGTTHNTHQCRLLQLSYLGLSVCLSFCLSLTVVIENML